MDISLCILPDLSLDELKKRLYLVIVFNDEEFVEKEDESPHFQSFKKTLGQLAGYKERILFGLELYKGTLYKNIYTIDKSVFMGQVYKDIFG